jgi:hypothetical protein
MQPKLLQSVPTALEGDANLGERAPSFDEFYQDSFRRLFTALCLVTGDRHEAEEIARNADQTAGRPVEVEGDQEQQVTSPAAITTTKAPRPRIAR